MSRTIMIFLIVITSLLCGCVTQQERVDHIRAQYPQLDQDSVQQLAEGRIRVGMTEEMVITAKGKAPFTHKEDGKVVWEYVDYRTDSWGVKIPTSSIKVYFQNRRVIDIREES